MGLPSLLLLLNLDRSKHDQGCCAGDSLLLTHLPHPQAYLWYQKTFLQVRDTFTSMMPM